MYEYSFIYILSVLICILYVHFLVFHFIVVVLINLVMCSLIMTFKRREQYRFHLKFPISLQYILIGLWIHSLSHLTSLPSTPFDLLCLLSLLLTTVAVLISSSTALARTITEIDFLITYLRAPVSYFREISFLAENIGLSLSPAINLTTVA